MHFVYIIFHFVLKLGNATQYFPIFHFIFSVFPLFTHLNQKTIKIKKERATKTKDK